MHTAAVAACEAGADKPHDKMKASMSSEVTRLSLSLVGGAMCCVSFFVFATSLERLDSRLSIVSSAVMMVSGFVVVARQH